MRKKSVFQFVLPHFILHIKPYLRLFCTGMFFFIDVKYM